MPSTTVALHLNPKNGSLLGVWVEDRGVPNHAYTGGAAYHQQVGAGVMAERVAADKGGPDWDSWTDYLSDRTPVDAWWEAVPRQQKPDGSWESAIDALSRLRRQDPTRR